MVGIGVLSGGSGIYGRSGLDFTFILGAIPHACGIYGWIYLDFSFAITIIPIQAEFTFY
jgi:hypothetical protein